MNSRSRVIKRELLKTIPQNIPINLTDQGLFSLPSIEDTLLALKTRDRAISLGMYAMVTWQWINPLAKWIGTRKCLEVMSGRGWLSLALRHKGVTIHATDNFSWFEKRDWRNPVLPDIEHLDAVASIKKYGSGIDILIMSWPPYAKNDAYQAIKTLHEVNPSAVVVFIGEDFGGCTADDEFFEHFAEISDPSFERIPFQAWYCVHDRLFLGKYTQESIQR